MYFSRFSGFDAYDRNHGFLALLAPQYFEFGIAVMKEAVKVFRQENFFKYGNDVFQQGRSCMELKMAEFERVFNECSSADREYAPKIAQAEKRTIVEFIVERTANSYFGSQLKQFREENTGKRGKSHVANSFRPHLASICPNGVVKNKKRLEEAEKKKNRA